MSASLLDFTRWALIAQGSYALFDASSTPEQALTKSGSGDFTEAEAKRFLDAPDFANGFVLLKDQPNEVSGFSASVFFDRSSNKYVLGIRGTEDFNDLVEDIARIGIQGYAGDQLVSLYRYYKKLTAPAGQAVRYSDSEVSTLQSIRLGISLNPASLIFTPARSEKLRQELALDVGFTPGPGSGTSVLPPGAPLVVTGHSLGGHLALLFGRFFPDVTEHVYTYNAPGIGLQGEIALRALGIPPLQASLVTNVSAVGGTEAISKILSKPGENIGIATEPGSLLHQHSIVPLTDALALYDAFGTLSPGDSLDASVVSGIISAASPFPENSLEVVLDQLGTLLDTGSAPTLIARTGSDLAERDDYYQKLYKVLDGREPGRDYQIESLVGKTATQIASSAASDVSVRFALTELMSFHAKNADYDSLDGKVFSGAWIASRAEMLEGMLKGNLIDRPYGVTGTEDSIVYRDVDSGVNFSLLDNTQYQAALPMTSIPSERQSLLDYLDDATYRRSVAFGSDAVAQGDRLIGLAGGDRLFGGNGGDQLDGGSGDDYLDGGAGEDILLGGIGDDLLDGNEGSDRLEGGPGNDTYVFGPDLGIDTIVDRDGRIFAGATQLIGGATLDDGPYVSGDGKFSYEFSGDLLSSGLLIVNGVLRVEDFRNGDLGIRLVKGEVAAPGSPATSDELLGDFEYQPYENELHELISGDEFGNPVPQMRVAAVPGRPDDEFLGTPGNTHFVMGGGNDVAHDRFGGDDHLELGEGADIGFGGEGDDLIEGGPGRDFLAGGRGDDTLIAGQLQTYRDDIAGTGGDDPQGNWGDWLSGGDGDDSIFGDPGGNLIEGGAGADRIHAGAGGDFIKGDRTAGYQESYSPRSTGGGVLTVSQLDFLGGSGPVWSVAPAGVFGPYSPGFSSPTDSLGPSVDGPGDGDDAIDAGAGNDTVYGGGGDDLILGGAGDDYIDGGAGADTVYAGDGSDYVSAGTEGSADFDYVDGGAGVDRLVAARGVIAELHGSAGNDQLESTGGNVSMFGDDGDDSLFAFEGGGVLDGGAGSDILVASNLDGGRTEFHWGRGYGADIAGCSFGAMDLEMVDVLPEELSISRVNTVFQVPGIEMRLAGTQDVLTLLGASDFPDIAELRIDFADGTSWDWETIDSLLADGDSGPAPEIAGSAGDDVLYGASDSDALRGGTGKDWLIGGAGDDTYSYGRGDGFDEIEDLDESAGNLDTLVFGGDISPAEVGLFAQGDDFILGLGDGGVRIRGGRSPASAIERIEFSDGTRWSPGDLEARVEMLPDNRAPGMPSSFGSVSVDPGAPLHVVLPGDAISDPDRFDSVSLYAISADGEKLPDWLHFDASSLTLAGTPSGQDAGVHELLVIAADASGAAAVSGLTITVGDEVPAPGGVIPEQATPQQAPPPVSERVPPPIAPPPAAKETIAVDAPASQAVAAPFRRADAFSEIAAAPPSRTEPSRFGDAADPSFREIQHSTDVLLQTGRTNLGERYAEAIREFEERRLQREEAPLPPPPTDEEVEAWSAAMHSWHDRNPGFAETDLGGNDGTWSMGWGLPGPGDSVLGGTAASSLQPGLANPNALGRFQGVASTPSLSEGFRDVR